MDYSLQAQSRLSKLSNYNNWVVSAFEGSYGRRILDVGSSIGNITEQIIKNVKPQIIASVEPDPSSYEILKSRLGGYDGFQAFNLDITSDDVKPLKNIGFDTVTCFNVLEHIEDDTQALANMSEVLVEDGKLLLFVPANKKLYGVVDESDGHYRRYAKDEIRQKADDTGFQLEGLKHFNMPGVIPWLLYGKLSRPDSYPMQGSLKALDSLVRLYSPIEKLIHPPFGLSIAATLRKK